MAASSPENLQITDQGTNYLAISWSLPILHSCPYQYSVRYHSFRLRETCVNTNSTNLIINNLLPCSNYHLSLRAFTSSGQSSSAVTLEAGTLPDKPGPVDDLRVAETGADFVTVEWDVPEDNPTCVKGYDATCYESNQNGSRLSITKVETNEQFWLRI